MVIKPNNRVFCVDCNRLKLLFDSEKKARTFIRFNAEEISRDSGRAPQRIYYCECCGGWHVTSMRNIPIVKRKKYNC